MLYVNIDKYYKYYYMVNIDNVDNQNNENTHTRRKITRNQEILGEEEILKILKERSKTLLGYSTHW